VAAAGAFAAGFAEASIYSVPSGAVAGTAAGGAEVLSHCFSPQSSQALQPRSVICVRDTMVSVAA